MNPKASHEEETVKKGSKKTPVPKIQETKMGTKNEKEEGTRTIEKSRKPKSIPESEEKIPRRKGTAMRAVSAPLGPRHLAERPGNLVNHMADEPAASAMLCMALSRHNYDSGGNAVQMFAKNIIANCKYGIAW